MSEIISKFDIAAKLLEMINDKSYESEEVPSIFKVVYREAYQKGLRAAYNIVLKAEPVNAVELPCKVGETVYIIERDNDDKIRQKTILKIDILQSNIICYFDDDKFNSNLFNCCTKSDFGKIVFLTREEAERVLEEIKK